MKIDIKFDGKAGYGVYINELKELKFDAKVAIVTNAKVGGLYLQNLLSRIDCPQKFIISVPDGEEYKNMQTIEAILEQLFVSRLDRSSVIIALGGGVVSDMAGFAASVFERGIKFINIPTTLLAQVDASVGGKTGVNNKFGKNLIGSFYQPSAVYCETGFLKTLEKREFAKFDLPLRADKGRRRRGRRARKGRARGAKLRPYLRSRDRKRNEL